jgi:hypothetical protein
MAHGIRLKIKMHIFISMPQGMATNFIGQSQLIVVILSGEMHTYITYYIHSNLSMYIIQNQFRISDQNLRIKVIYIRIYNIN